MSNPFKAWLIAPQSAPGRARDIEAIEQVLGEYECIQHDGFVTAEAIKDAFSDDLGIDAHKGPRLLWVLAAAVQDEAGAWCLDTYGLKRLPISDLWELVSRAATRWPHDRMVVVFDVCNASATVELPDAMTAFAACGADEKTLARDGAGGWLTQTLTAHLLRGVTTPAELLTALHRDRPPTQRPTVHLGAHPGVAINVDWPIPAARLDGEARDRRQAAQAALSSRLRDIVGRSGWLSAHFICLHGPGDVVDQICNLPGDEVASWLYCLAGEHPTELDVVREIACLIMPILTDWTRLQAMLTRQLVEDDRFLRLPVVDLSVCEMIMAGLDGRSAAFIREQKTCVGILADANLARIHRPALFSAPLLPTREARHMPEMVAKAIVTASGRVRRGDVFRQARGILIATRLAYQSYLVVDEACAKAAIDAVLAEKRLPGLRVAQAFEDPEYEVLSSALETVLELLFPQDDPQDAHGH